MEIKKELLEKMISQAEEFNALAYAVPVSEYKDWIVRVSIEKREFLVERNKIA